MSRTKHQRKPAHRVRFGCTCWSCTPIERTKKYRAKKNATVTNEV